MLAAVKTSNEVVKFKWTKEAHSGSREVDATRLCYRFDDCLLQFFCRKWFPQERDPAYRRDLAPDTLIVMPTHENNRVLESICREVMRQLHPSTVAEMIVNHQASRFACGGSLEKCRG